MRIRRQPAAFGEFLPEILQMPVVQTPLDIRPRIHARRGVALEENDVTGKIFRMPAEEMILRRLRKVSPQRQRSRCARQRSWSSWP